MSRGVKIARRLWAAVVLLGLFVSPVPRSVALTKPQAPIVTCQEDDPCWNWRTMGDRCGRDTLDEPIHCFDEYGREMRP